MSAILASHTRWAPIMDHHSLATNSRSLPRRWHVRVAPYAPWANRTIEYFMRSLGKVLKTSYVKNQDWRTALNVFQSPIKPLHIAPLESHQHFCFSMEDHTVPHNTQQKGTSQMQRRTLLKCPNKTLKISYQSSCICIYY